MFFLLFFRVPSPFFSFPEFRLRRVTPKTFNVFVLVFSCFLFPGSVPVFSLPEFRLRRVTPKYIQCFSFCFSFLLFPGSAPSLFFGVPPPKETNHCFSPFFSFRNFSEFRLRKETHPLYVFVYSHSLPQSLGPPLV